MNSVQHLGCLSNACGFQWMESWGAILPSKQSGRATELPKVKLFLSGCLEIRGRTRVGNEAAGVIVKAENKIFVE